MKYGVGIDVSKDWLDVHVYEIDKVERLPNTTPGFARLVTWLRRFPVGRGCWASYPNWAD